MEIERQYRRVEIGDNLFRNRVTILGPKCEADSQLSRQAQGLFLTWLSENRALLECGYAPFDTLSIKHNGERWICECEAIGA